jgi:hypothetical protein
MNVRSVWLAVAFLAAREPEDSSDGFICDMHSDSHTDWTLLSPAPLSVLCSPRSTRGT